MRPISFLARLANDTDASSFRYLRISRCCTLTRWPFSTRWAYKCWAMATERVMPAGTTDGNHQLAFPFGTVERQHVIDQIQQPGQKSPGFPANASHSRAPARPTPSGAAILPHNRGSAGSAHRTASPIRWGSPCFKSKTHAVDGQSVAGIPQKQVAHALFELCRGQ